MLRILFMLFESATFMLSVLLNLFILFILFMLLVLFMLFIIIIIRLFPHRLSMI